MGTDAAVNEEDSEETGGEFQRDTDYIPDRITARRPRARARPDRRAGCGRSSPAATGSSRRAPARGPAGRSSCGELLGLEDVISLGLCGPTHDVRSWTFDLDPGGVDPVLGIERLQQAYFARFPAYEKGITVPAMVDVPTGQVVTNDFPWITHDLFHEWREFHRPDAPDLWPRAAARRDGRGDGAGLHRGQQRRVPLRLRQLAGRVRRGVRPALDGPRLARGPADPTGAT